MTDRTIDPIIEQLDALRRAQGIGQVELADRCGIKQGNLSRYLSGSKTPTLPTLRRIAAALGRDVMLHPVGDASRR